jgi:hypothetical protein
MTTSQTNDKHTLVPAVVFQQPHELALVEGEATKRLELWEEDLALVAGGKVRRPFPTRCQWGPYIRNDD